MPNLNEKTVYWAGWLFSILSLSVMTLFAGAGMLRMDLVNIVLTICFLVMAWGTLFLSAYLFKTEKNSKLAVMILVGFYGIVFILPAVATNIFLLFD